MGGSEDASGTVIDGSITDWRERLLYSGTGRFSEEKGDSYPL